MKNSKRLTDPALHALGAALRSQREKSDLSQEKLAALAGVHHNYVSALERGQKNISIKTILRLCKVLRVSLSALMRDMEARMNDGG